MTRSQVLVSDQVSEHRYSPGIQSRNPVRSLWAQCPQQVLSPLPSLRGMLPSFQTSTLKDKNPKIVHHITPQFILFFNVSHSQNVTLTRLLTPFNAAQTCDSLAGSQACLRHSSSHPAVHMGEMQNRCYEHIKGI